MPFFIRGKGKPNLKKKTLKKPLKAKRVNGSHLPKKPKAEPEDEEITSEEEADFSKHENQIEQSRYRDLDEETPQEKKVRLAQQYLEEIKKQAEEEAEDEEALNKTLDRRLQQDVLEAAGKFQKKVADCLEGYDSDSIQFLRCKHHKRPLTCLVVSYDENVIFSASKDATIVKWDLQGKKLAVINSSHKTGEKGHDSHILSLALSMDGKYLASGDQDGLLHIWDAETLRLLKTFRKHKQAVSALVFRRGTHTLYSASHDRLVFSWNLDAMSFAESLGGHQDAITGIDALMRESCVTSGGRDEMVIVYVIPDEKQLRFSANQSSIDGVKLVNEKTFISFGQNGSLALWTTLKKRPHFMVKEAHGKDPISGEAHWLTAAAAFVNTDVVASGSYDGQIRLWKINHQQRSLAPLFSVPVEGVVNGLEFTSSGSHLIAAVGQEHKLGRWFTEKSAKNCLVIIPLKSKS